MANGTKATTTGSFSLPIVVGKKKLTHTFQVLPGLNNDMIIGIDLWKKLDLTLHPPKQIYKTRDSGSSIANTEGITPCTKQQQNKLKNFLDKEIGKFTNIVGPTPHIQHRIILKKGTTPVKQRYRPRNPAIQAIIDTEVNQMLQDGVIEPSSSAWSSPIVVVKKKDGKHRFCIDFRKVNELSEKDAYPLPQIPATLDKLRGARYLSTLDLKSGYWQVALTPDSKPITAFTVPGRGLMQFKVMPFGLHTAPATFQRLLDNVLGPDLEPNVLVYLDDIIIATSSFEEHIRLLSEVFRRLRKARLKINIEKCNFCRSELKYLGHIIGENGLQTDPSKTNAVTDWPIPTTIRKIRQFLGMASWYRRFIPNFSAIAAPITQLTKKNTKWRWGKEEQEAFGKLKEALTTTPVLACPDFTRRFILQTDASKHGLGAVLTQHLDEGERVIAYASRTLNKAEINYSATELECLAVVWGINRMRDYLEGYTFTVITDHQSLKWLHNMESPTGRLGRWKMQLQQYDFDIKYRKGTANVVADALSRQHEICTIDKMPKCKWYCRMFKKAQENSEEIPDYAIKKEKLTRHILHDLNFYETPSDLQWKECVPEEERKAVIQRYHDEPASGHLGIAKTITRVAHLYYWPGMFRDIAKYVRNCKNCISYKADQRKPAGIMQATPCGKPWEQVAIDLIGPLPRSTQGKTWLLTMQDRFSKWLEVEPLRKATASAVTRAFTDTIIYRHGCPDIVISDNGTQFMSGEMKKTLEKFKIQHRNTPPYTPQCNPVERANRTIKTMISQFVGDNHKEWDKRLHALVFAFNSARNDATGFSPAYILQGRELPGTHPEERGKIPEAQEPRRKAQELEEVRDLVKINLARSFQKQSRHYDLRKRQWQPKIGEKVWKKEHTLSNKLLGINAKLAPRYTGPYEVRRIISPVIFDLQDEKRKWYRHIHVKDLKQIREEDDSH